MNNCDSNSVLSHTYKRLKLTPETSPGARYGKDQYILCDTGCLHQVYPSSSYSKYKFDKVQLAEELGFVKFISIKPKRPKSNAEIRNVCQYETIYDIFSN